MNYLAKNSSSLAIDGTTRERAAPSMPAQGHHVREMRMDSRAMAPFVALTSADVLRRVVVHRHIDRDTINGFGQASLDTRLIRT